MLSATRALIPLLFAPLVARADVLHYDTTPNGFKAPPKGWNSFALQALTDSLKFQLNQENVIKQCDAMRKELGEYGYEYCSLDSGWSLPYDGDDYGRITYDSALFDIPALADHLHDNGAKLGIYILPGFFSNDLNKVIYGTNISLSSILADEAEPCRAMARCNINYDAPGAQQWCDSNVQQFADWGVDLLKLDYVTPGSPDAGADLSVNNSGSVACYHKAIEKVGRPMRLNISWKLNRTSTYYGIWKSNADSMRTDQDINNSGQTTLVQWSTVQRAIEQYRQYILLQLDSIDPLTIYPDMDNLLVANAETLTGLTDLQRQSVMSHWIGAGSNLILGSDLTQMDDFGMSLLSNPLANEILNFTAKYPMVPTKGNTNDEKGQQKQIWIAGPDSESGVTVVVLANYGANGSNDLFDSTPEDTDQEFQFSPKDLGFSGGSTYTVDDVWSSSKIELDWEDSHTWTLDKDGAAILLRFTPSLNKSNTSSQFKRALAAPRQHIKKRATPSSVSPTSTSSRAIILQTQSALPIESPQCWDDGFSALPGNLTATDGPITPVTLLYRMRQMICNSTCAAPEGVNASDVAIYSTNNGDTCEISVGITSDLEAYMIRTTPPVGSQAQQCWDSTYYIVDGCITSERKTKGWWNGNHVYQFYEAGFRKLNNDKSYHILSAHSSISTHLPAYTGPAVHSAANASVYMPTPSPAANLSATSTAAAGNRTTVFATVTAPAPTDSASGAGEVVVQWGRVWAVGVGVGLQGLLFLLLVHSHAA
ncbi:Glycoside hydrolase family 27 [Neofusicoccum parvum]|uniref:Glycoside hydrolase family 27 n=1 Tax=Neofusicoccum parvum TaxID=310453 RepID=A0ACB5RR03_9PEZI|nr:Glycoside hydrolase family 27 [Neofusicoccum parvum]